jgi:expansin (peptidoglycan-binding protein)
MIKRRRIPVYRPGGLQSPSLQQSPCTSVARRDRLATAAGLPVAVLAPFAVLTSLAGCSLTADLGSLTAKSRQVDASSMPAPPDAFSIVDTPAPWDGSATAHPQDAQIDLGTNSSDGNPPEDSVVGTTEDRPGDSSPLPDTTENPDSKSDDDGRSSDMAMASADAAATPDGNAGTDGTPDALLMCPRLPSLYATLHLTNSTSTTTSCGYARGGLSGYVAAVDPTTFAGSASCGACVRIETAAAVVVAQVVELGPRPSSANPSALAVNRSALSLLVPDGSTFVEQGVAWRFVPCPLSPTTAMTFQFQEGSNANYAALLIQKHRFPLASVEYLGNGGYRSLVRSSYNHWVAASGMGGGPFTVRVTDVLGHSVEQKGVPLRPGVAFQGQVQFPECSND